MEIADCAIEFIGLVRAAFEQLSKEGPDVWISASEYLRQRLKNMHDQYKRQILDSAIISEPCKM